MRILFLSDNFPPEVNAPASRTFEHCREWVKAGHEVTVITCAPNFPKGELYAGYRNRLWQWETLEGIRVLRVWSYLAPNQGTLKPTLDFMSYMVTSFLGGLVLPRPDVIVGTSPQFFTVCSAWMLSVFRWRPFVFELRDLWPESLVTVGAMNHPLLIGRLERLELFLYRRAAVVVALTEAFRRDLARRGIDPGKIERVTNGVDLARFFPRPRDRELAERLGLVDKFVVGYVGTHGRAHALETVLAAADRLRQRPEGAGVCFLLLGHGARKEALKAQAAAMGLDNVLFLDTVSKDEVPRYWSLLDVSVVHLKKTEKFDKVLPSKLFECMGMGIPVLQGVAGESADLVQREAMGLVFESENAEALGDAILRLAADRDLYERLRENCLAAAQRYERGELARRMLGILEGVVGGPGAGGRVRQ